jgi:hypothetical protein
VVCPVGALLFLSLQSLLCQRCYQTILFFPDLPGFQGTAERMAQSKDHWYNMEAGMPRFSPAFNLFLCVFCFVWFFCFCGTEVWTQDLHFKLLHQFIFFVKGFFQIGSRKLFAWNGFKPRSSCSLPLSS